MKLVGVISDTHGLLSHDAYAALADCDVIIHAGDIGDPSVLAQLQELAPVYAVLGNNDFSEYGPSVCSFAKPVVEGVRFLVSHYPRDVRSGPFGYSALAADEPMPDICIHGHTHLPKLQYGKDARPAQLMLCPGSATRPRSEWPRTIAKIEIDNGKILNARIEGMKGAVLMSNDFTQ